MKRNQQVKYILLITLGVTAVVFVFLLSRSMKIMDDMNAAVDKEHEQVLILTTDKVTDQSWGSRAYKGKMKMESLYDVEVDLESEVNLENDLDSLVQQYIQGGTELIIGHGREFSESFYELSNQHSETQFVTVHGDYINNNLAVYTFDHQEIEYVAGAAAALKTKAQKIGVIDAINNKHKDWGFPAGVQSINPEIELVYDVVYSRDDHKKALQIAREMMEQGVDVIYSKGNSYNQSVINFAKTNGIFVIGYLEDQAYMAEDAVLTSVLNDVSQVYAAIMKDFLSEEGIEAEKKYLTTRDGVYGLASLGNMYTEEEMILIENIKKEILQES
ncbi:BMP family ABC transporter substrate-binding protein [Gracilibacillus oryzae]|uniref:BMP family ABC transporter substrate-binding protein n=1 Tax=Gracilibacillus oryzae TaxID=1672701 RepID=A0A7C8L8R8_9BACI|nr:BMP family ABC transporter substrate-binding protein [Gracilibacillus oryzae]KAB8138406.1 BMP family ABC transporter substrate-binding protein [Gracilibacillus oryzae]